MASAAETSLGTQPVLGVLSGSLPGWSQRGDLIPAPDASGAAPKCPGALLQLPWCQEHLHV